MDNNVIILDIPCRERIVRHAGADIKVLEFDGLWQARYSDTDVQTISNPLKEFVAIYNGFNDGQVVFRLVSTNYSNPGLDDNGPSLVHDNFRV